MPEVAPGRAVIIGRLQAELRQAEGCFEHARAAELREQIAGLSRGSADNPATETTAAPRAAAARALKKPARTG